MDVSRAADEGHADERLGEYCEECDTRHRLLESFPKNPLPKSTVAQLRDSPSIQFIRGVAWETAGYAGYDSDEMLARHIVISTGTTTQLVTFYEDVGWIVERDFNNEDFDEPSRAGDIVWYEASRLYSQEKMAEMDVE